MTAFNKSKAGKNFTWKLNERKQNSQKEKENEKCSEQIYFQTWNMYLLSYLLSLELVKALRVVFLWAKIESELCKEFCIRVVLIGKSFLIAKSDGVVQCWMGVWPNEIKHF